MVEELTGCCNAYSTYFDEELVCKVCLLPVPFGVGDGGAFALAKIEAETNWVERVGGCLTCGTLDDTHFFDRFARVCADCVLAAVIEDQIIGGDWGSV